MHKVSSSSSSGVRCVLGPLARPRLLTSGRIHRGRDGVLHELLRHADLVLQHGQLGAQQLVRDAHQSVQAGQVGQRGQVREAVLAVVVDEVWVRGRFVTAG